MKNLNESIQGVLRWNRRVLPGMAVIFILVLLIIMRWGYNYHHAVMEEISAKEEIYLQALSMARRGDEFIKLKEAREARLKEMEKGLIKAEKPQTAVAELQETFKTITSKRGITVISEKALPFSGKGPYIRIPVEFQFKTELPQLKDLLYDMQASPAVIGVRTLRLKNSDEKNPGRLDVLLVIEGAIKKAGA